jgi:hypothetical protein
VACVNRPKAILGEFAMNYIVPQYIPSGSTPYEQYYRKIVKVQPIGSSHTVKGEVVSITDRHITLEHLDGRRSLIRLSEIAVISEVPCKPRPEAV